MRVTPPARCATLLLHVERRLVTRACLRERTRLLMRQRVAYLARTRTRAVAAYDMLVDDSARAARKIAPTVMHNAARYESARVATIARMRYAAIILRERARFVVAACRA